MKAFFTLLGLSTLFLFSCGGDDCDPSMLSDAIIGSWDVQVSGVSQGQVEFLEDGTLIDEDDILVSGSVGMTSLDDKSYRINGNDSVTLRAEAGSNFEEFTVTVTSISCEQIDFTAFGAPASFIKQ